jgi:hypothetical protein
MCVTPSLRVNNQRLTLIDSINAAAIMAADVADMKADVAADNKAEMARTVTSSAMI